MFVYVFMLILVLGTFIYSEGIASTGSGQVHCAEAKGSKSMLILVFAILLFISTFRADRIGADHEKYVALFRSIESAGTLYFAQNGEIGYVFLNKIAHFISENSYSLNFVVTFLLLFGYYVYIKNFVEPSYWWMALMVFVLHPYLYIQSSFNAMRQCCAMGIVMFATYFLHKEKKLRFVILCVAAGTFHKSALAMILLLVIYFIPWNKMLHQLIAVVMFMINILPTEKLMALIASVLKYDVYSSYEASILNNKAYTLFIAVVIMVLLSKYDKLYTIPKEKLCVDIYLLSMSFLLFAVKNDMLYRVYMYLALLSVPGITVICKNAFRFVRPSTLVKYLYVGYYACFYIGYIGLLVINQNEHYVPFLFLWNA